jgi:hypothetical protein
MDVNNETIMKEDYFANPIPWLWVKISFSSILKQTLSKFIKLAKIACVQVLRFVEDEHCFSIMAYMKNKLKNHLTFHLDFYIHFFTQQFYNIENFPFEKVMTRWKNTI